MSNTNYRYSFEDKLAPHNKAILQACRIGDLARLLKLFQDHNTRPEPRASWREDPHGPPNTRILLDQAVAYQHAHIVRYILSTDPSENLATRSTVRALVETQNLEIAELLRARAPEIVNMELSHFDTFLSAACRGGDRFNHDNLPGDDSLHLIHYLLDNGADPSEGSWSGCSSIPVAIDFSRPLEIIDKMIEKGGVVNLLVFSSALRRRRMDALQLFFDKAAFSVSIDDMLKRARESEDEEIMAIVERGVVKVRKRGYRRKSTWRKGLAALSFK